MVNCPVLQVKEMVKRFAKELIFQFNTTFQILSAIYLKTYGAPCIVRNRLLDGEIAPD